MTNEENLEIQSTRYIAPRVMMLTSGNIAIIPMMGKGAPVIVEPKNFYDLQSYIPHVDELDAKYRTITEAHVRRPTATSRRHPSTSLDDLV